MSANERYFLSSLGQVSYGIEGTKYSKAGTLDNWFGLMTEDIEPPNPNPHTPKSTGGKRRGPYVQSPDERMYELEVPFEVLDHNAPFEVALGQRTTTAKDPDSDGTDEYNEHLITEADKLPTLTIQHQQEDADLQAWYIGGKSNLELSANEGEAVSASMSFMFPKMDFDDSVTSGYTDLDIPQQSPYRFWMKGDVELTEPGSSTSVKTLATVSGFSLSWDNGLEVNNHGDGRDGYSVKETTAAEKYDMSLTVTITDTDLYKRAANNDAPVDVEIPLYRDPSASDHFDAMIIRLKRATIVDAPAPNPSEGDLEAEIALQPTDTEIELRESLI